MRSTRLRIAAVGLALYVLLFAVGHIAQPETGLGAVLWNVAFTAGMVGPIVAVALASQVWPLWWFPVAVLVVFLVVPLAVEGLEILVDWAPVDSDEGWDELTIDFIGTSIISVLAWPLGFVALVGVLVARLRASRAGAPPPL